MSDRIPVTLLTGFLGAGKTTLLNHLLHDSTGGRIAVIVNEFGEAGLDHDLIEASAEDVILMASGCICCSIRSDLSRTLTSLQGRRARGELAFDRVVIETTGLADPGPIHHTLLLDRPVADAFRLDGIVTAVDAVLGAGTLDRHAEAQAQVAMADRIVLTKCDLATPARIADLERRLNPLNPHARRIRADRGRVPQGVLFGLTTGRDSGDTSAALAWMGLSQPDLTPDPLAGLSGFVQPAVLPVFPPAAPSHHARDSRVATASITIDTPIPPGVFDFWLDMIMGLQGDAILRLKAIVHLDGAIQPFVLHGVQHILEPPVPLENWSGDDRTSRVVLIARDMPVDELEASLDLLRMRAGVVAGQAISMHSLDDL
ncbi:MAG: CobW family GTP-binding protein [Paracoccus sp. (in: a-proteobacteria)]|uniref:CobW family GTP-binding protein n=1 Tax=Paracoccus sp. TaxID=267 RepID=UPI00391C228B